jgi:hypothetical protein
VKPGFALSRGNLELPGAPAFLHDWGIGKSGGIFGVNRLLFPFSWRATAGGATFLIGKG